MSQKIQVKIKTVYGVDRAYPICSVAKLLCELGGGKSFTDKDIKVIKKLGYEIEVVQGENKL